jgi:serine/threonine protein kinase
MSLSTGVRPGPYEILTSIGAGGMGEVYKATDTRLERTVAIEVLPHTYPGGKSSESGSNVRRALSPA